MNHIPKEPSYRDLEFLQRCRVDTSQGLVFGLGGEIGSLHEGRIRIRAIERTYRRSHVVFWAFHKRWPKYLIDHKNRVTTDDRIDNLRELSSRGNALNTHRNDRELPHGVYKAPAHNKGSDYCAKIWVAGRYIHLGMFNDMDLASTAVQEAIANLEDYGPEFFVEESKEVKTLPVGVHWHKYNKKKPYKAKGWRNGKEVHLGYFATPEEAHNAYLAFRSAK